jgi:hypothetical protein
MGVAQRHFALFTGLPVPDKIDRKLFFVAALACNDENEQKTKSDRSNYTSRKFYNKLKICRFYNNTLKFWQWNIGRLERWNIALKKDFFHF